MSAVCQQNFNYFNQKLADAISKFMGPLEMPFEDDPALLDNLVVEDEVTFNGVEGHKLFAPG